jgi:hypothetical protein
MPNLADGWRPLQGISCNGWDIWLGISDQENSFAIFRRRLDETKAYTMGRPLKGSDGFKRMDLVRSMFYTGTMTAEELFADDIAWERSQTAYRTNPNYGLF